ncbi:DUF1385 domain-containing protein, partial [Candidatus Woesearchaeota archaeon]|nr:DUF1385 domain-containing protein [Candidatus Woesearchaeota archaeon]
LEGVMMKNKESIVTAVRKNKKIVFQKIKTNSLTQKKIFSIPIIRGIVVLFETLILGVKTLNYSASQIADESQEKLKWWHIALSLGLAVVFALVIFKLIPLAIAQLFSKKVYGGRLAFNLVEGLSKIIILVGYIYSISFLHDVKRMFMYHGAEHKAVNCYESGKKLTVKNAKKFSTIHTRCGTSFLLFVLLISIIFYYLIPMDIGFFYKYGLRILLLPIIAGVSYEALKLSSKYPSNPLLKVFMTPGLLLQGITTKEPTEKQLEVALFALKKVV